MARWIPKIPFFLAFLTVCGYAQPAWSLASMYQGRFYNNPLYQQSNYAKSPHSNTPDRFSYMNHNTRLNGSPHHAPCIEHGQARCLGGNQKPERYPSRYSNPLANQQSINPRLRNNFKYQQARQNF